MSGGSGTRLRERENGYGPLISGAVEALRSGRAEAAELCLKKALLADYARPETFNLLGVLMEYRLEPARAQSYYRAALALDPTFLPARRNLDRMVRSEGGRAWDLGEA